MGNLKKSEHFLSAIVLQWRIQDFSDGCVNPRGGTSTIIWQEFCGKLHEMKEFGPGGVCPDRPPWIRHRSTKTSTLLTKHIFRTNFIVSAPRGKR